MRWEDAFLSYLKSLEREKPVVLCGDLNVAHQEIDIKNPKSNRMNAGFTDQEREKMTRLLNAGFVDTFRALHPDETGAYSWVVLSLPCARKQRRVAHRLLYCVRVAERACARGGHPSGDFRLRSLPGGAGAGYLSNVLSGLGWKIKCKLSASFAVLWGIATQNC